MRSFCEPRCEVIRVQLHSRVCVGSSSSWGQPRAALWWDVGSRGLHRGGMWAAEGCIVVVISP